MSFVDCVRRFTAENDAVGYYAGAGDNDHDGTPDRADFNDGNGVDCSGWVWACYAHCVDPDPIPLSSSAGYAFLGKQHGWIVPLAQAQPGDMLIYDKYNDAFASTGPRGHVGILVEKQGQTWLTSESRGGGHGVGLYPRPWNFWVMAVRVPVGQSITPGQLDDLITDMEALEVDAVTQQMIKDIHEYISLRKKTTRAPQDPPHVASDQVILDTGTGLGELKKGWAGNLVELGQKLRARLGA